jgi:hypothetical protein
MDYFLNYIKSLESEKISENATISISSNKLKVRGVHFDTIESLGSGLTTNGRDDFIHKMATLDKLLNPHEC